ncbi:hypothetical protein JW698_00750 [Candidatus Wolfebacteria bacterium]|nr:hypothetical protein [Candidatus Wolfebacteria bacterium]
MNIKKVLNIINPQVAIGGLEVSDSTLKFIIVKDNKLESVSLNLPVGVIEEGKIKNKEEFKNALLNLHSQITPKIKKKIYLIVNIPDINVYIQVFNLPILEKNNFEEAVNLNLRMISPIDFSSVYADWQKVGKNKTDRGQTEILGAFISKKITDDFVECLKDTNFVVVAIEFSGLALSRLISGLAGLPNAFLLLYLTGSGLNFSLIKNSNLYFNHFVSWPISEEKQISFSSIKEIIIKEAQKILNFASSHWPDTLIKDVLLATPALDDKIIQAINENFSLSVKKIIIPSKIVDPENHWVMNNEKLSSLTPDWFSVLGSALRGLIPRSKDIIISLASTGTEEEFQQYQIINFIKIWRNIILTSLCFLLIAFIILEGFLVRTVNSLNSQTANLVNLPAMEEINKVQEEAKKFNNIVTSVLEAKKQIRDWSSFFENIKSLAGTDIVIERIFVQGEKQPILFNGKATDEASIINFKNKLESESNFKEISLPLSGISSSKDGGFTFNINFKLE